VSPLPVSATIGQLADFHKTVSPHKQGI